MHFLINKLGDSVNNKHRNMTDNNNKNDVLQLGLEKEDNFGRTLVMNSTSIFSESFLEKILLQDKNAIKRYTK